jgi:hypothetical protein
MTLPTPARAGLVLAGVLGLGDMTLIAGGDGGPPLAVRLVSLALGIATVVAVLVAWRTGAAAALWTVVATRIVSALTALPAFFADDVPTGFVAVAAVGVLLTLVAIVLLRPALRSRSALV